MVQNFTLVAVKPGSPIDNSPITATQSGLHLKSHEQHAIFQLKGDELFLYNDPPAQKLYTDRSGMGQGILQYTRDAAAAAGLNPNRIEQSGWAVHGDHLQLKGTNFLATPGGSGGSWAVWMNTGNPNPGGQSGGVEFEAKIVPVSHPTGHHYSTLCTPETSTLPAVKSRTPNTLFVHDSPPVPALQLEYLLVNVSHVALNGSDWSKVAGIISDIPHTVSCDVTERPVQVDDAVTRPVWPGDRIGGLLYGVRIGNLER